MAAHVRIGIVGCGKVTTEHHLPALAAVPDARVAAVHDVDTAAAQRVARATGAEALGSVDALVARVDLVAVCVPPLEHAEVAVAALVAGRAVFLEKPLATTREDAERIASAAAGRVLVVGFHLRHHPFVRRARAALEAGSLGELRAISTSMTTSDLHGWRARRELGGGVLQDLGPHHFDLWRHLGGREVEAVRTCGSGSGTHDEAASVSALAGPLVASSLLASSAAPRNEVELLGAEGRLRLSLYRFDGFEMQARNARSRWRAWTWARRGVHAASYRNQWRHVVAVARGSEAPAAGLEDGLRALDITLAAEASRWSGERVPVA